MRYERRMSDPLYTSEPCARSLWQTYRIYPDRLELDLHLFGKREIPLGEIQAIEPRPPLVVGDLFRGAYPLEEMVRTIKLDLADLFPHLAVIKSSGAWRQLRITPRDPAAFLAAWERARDGLAEAPEGF